MLIGCSTGEERFQRSCLSDELEKLSGEDLGSGDGRLPPKVDLRDGLTEQEAVATAMWNNPAFQAALAELGLRRADLVQAGELPNPWLWFLFELESSPVAYNVRIPFEALWQRPSRVAAARADCERAAQQLLQGGLDLERDVRLAFADMRLTRAKQALFAQRAEAQRAIGAFTAQRLAAGDASELEKSIVDAAIARSDADVVRAEQAALLAENRVRALLGDAVAPDVAMVEGVPDLTPPEADARSLVPLAQEFRPDMRGAELAVEAAGERIGLSKAQIVQAQLLGDFKDSGANFGGAPGVFIAVPIFNQGQGGRMRAEAELHQALMRYRALAQQIGFEVREAKARLDTAMRLAKACSCALPHLEQAVHRAQMAWQNGDQARLPELEARLALLDANIQEADASAEVARATAELRRNIGGKVR